MKQKVNHSASQLLANGAARGWDVAVDEAADGDGWSLELDGPRTYLVFRLRDLDVVAAALKFLKIGSGTRWKKGDHDAESALPLGWFGSASVSLLWDNEDFPRCFIVVGPRARSTLRVTLEEEDIGLLREALQQVVKDLS